MKKYLVYGTVKIGVTVEVEAEDESDARERADSMCRIRSYCGNGRTHGALIGTSDQDVTLDVGENSPEWWDTEELP